MEKGLGSVTITGNHLIFNCVVSPGKSEAIHDDLQLMSMSSGVKGTEDAVASNKKTSAINRRRICSSTVYTKDAVIDSSNAKQSELEHILCDSACETERQSKIQTKGKPNNYLVDVSLYKEHLPRKLNSWLYFSGMQFHVLRAIDLSAVHFSSYSFLRELTV